MKFTLAWLKDHLETTAPRDRIAEALTALGLEVESVVDRAEALEKFVVAEIVAAEKHPNADKLQICKVDAGTGELLDVVCGAPNARKGLKTAFASVGTYIPGSDMTLSQGNIRGAVSNGMLCSGRELQLSDDQDGILELSPDAKVGGRLADALGLDTVVFDIALTPNRGDAAGVYGVARDLAALGLGTLKPTDWTPVPGAGPSPVAPLPHRFTAGAPKAIRKFAGRVIAGVTNGPSPAWLQARLRDVGLRPINALADITNFVSHGWGRPLHAYDFNRISGQMHLRNARPGEMLDGLDGRNYALDDAMCVIADDLGPLCLGGILGGLRSSCTEATGAVFIESASWEPLEIAKTGRKTGIVSDARYRFERGVDPALTEAGLELATRLVLEICGGTPAERVVSGEDPAPAPALDFPLGEVRRLTGLDLPPERIVSTLTALGFAVSGAGPTRRVAVPSWRPDVSQKADLVEEVLRLTGVDAVPREPLPRLTGVAARMLTPIQNRRRLAKRALAARGLDEAVTWSFISAADATRFGGGQPALKLANPIAAELSDMRPSLLPGLIAAARRNLNRGLGPIGLFEVGQVFLSDAPEGQHSFASALRVGAPRANWLAQPSLDVFAAKADLAALLDTLGFDLDKLQTTADAPAWAHPGRGGRVQLGPTKLLASFGELHPAWAKALDLDGPAVGFELDLDALPLPKSKATRAKPAFKLSDLMPVKRDFAFVLDRDVPAAAVLKAARGADKALIADAGIFDLFEGKGVPEGKKSLAVRVTLQPTAKTLTDEEIDKVAAAVVGAVGKATGGVLRT